MAVKIGTYEFKMIEKELCLHFISATALRNLNNFAFYIVNKYIKIVL